MRSDTNDQGLKLDQTVAGPALHSTAVTSLLSCHVPPRPVARGRPSCRVPPVSMAMEGSGGSQSQLIHPAVDEAALAVTKRERKRSRYLSPPYTDTGVLQEKKAAGSQKQREEGQPHVSGAEVLPTLRASALGQGKGMEAAALRFMAMDSRNRNSIFVDDHPDSHAAAGGASQDDGVSKPPSAAGVGRKMMLNLNAGPDDGSSLAKKRKRKTMKTVGQHSYVGNPVALVLDLAEGTPLPSREDLLSTFSRFGFVIDSETSITQDKNKHTARVVFATRAQAESALSCAATLGGAFAAPSVQDLPPITPLPKLPLTDIRNNLGKMILSLSSKAKSPQEANAKPAVDSLSLVGEMQHLLAKVDKVLQAQRASATDHHAIHH